MRGVDNILREVLSTSVNSRALVDVDYYLPWWWHRLLHVVGDTP